MKNQVIVTKHPETGAVITKNENKPAFGTIRVDQDVVTMEKGFINKTRRSAFLAGKLSDLESLNFKAGDILEGRIIRTETRAPQFEGHEPKKYPELNSDGTPNPKAGQTVMVDGAPVYFKDEYTVDVNQADTLIKGVIGVEELAPAKTVTA